MSIVTMSSAKDYDVNKEQPEKAACGEVLGLSVGDVVIVSSANVATKLDVSSYTGDGSDIRICLTEASENNSVLCALPGTDLIGITLSEGDVLYASGVGQVGDDFATDVTSGDSVIILGFYAESGSDSIFRFNVILGGYEKT